MSRKRLAAVLALLVALVVTSAPTSAQPSTVADPPGPGSAGIGDPYFAHDGNGGIDVLHYSVHDRYDFRSGRLSGWTRLRVQATKSLSRFNLDLLLPVTQVRINGRKARWSKPNRHELRIMPNRSLTAGKRFRVIVKYAGSPAKIGWKGERNWLANSDEVVTMNQPHMATWWFPANDHPSDKATFDLHITTDRDKQVIAGGRMLSRKLSRGGQARTHWRMAEPMASYLAFFAAGDFKVERGSYRGLRWVAAVSRALPPRQQRLAMRKLKKSGRIVTWLSGQIGRYPFGSTGGVVTNLQPGFALENQTRPTYPALGAGDDYLLVHELAHQWFGDDVAIDRWRDIWLNEGFATYYEARWVEARGGASTEQWLRRNHSAYSEDPAWWNLRVDDPGASRIFADPIYLRGGMTIAALRARIGEVDFNRLVRTWAATNAGGNVNTAEFETLAGKVSGEKLDAFFDAWLRAPRPPAATAANGLA